MLRVEAQQTFIVTRPEIYYHDIPVTASSPEEAYAKVYAMPREEFASYPLSDGGSLDLVEVLEPGERKWLVDKTHEFDRDPQQMGVGEGSG